jgi:hypothetical protein
MVAFVRNSTWDEKVSRVNVTNKGGRTQSDAGETDNLEMTVIEVLTNGLTGLISVELRQLL